MKEDNASARDGNEEAPHQGICLEGICEIADRGHVQSTRPTLFGLEMHLVGMHKAVEHFAPSAVVVDPISSLIAAGGHGEVKSMLVRLFDLLKQKKITALYTCLTPPTGLEQTDVGVSSLIDTWLEVRDLEESGERNRAMYVLKSRGMPHSNQVREFVLTSKGIDLIEAYIGPGGVKTGAARISQKAADAAAALSREQLIARKERELLRRRSRVEAKIATLRSIFDEHHEELQGEIAQLRGQESRLEADRHEMRRRRDGARATNGAPDPGGPPLGMGGGSKQTARRPS